MRIVAWRVPLAWCLVSACLAAARVPSVIAQEIKSVGRASFLVGLPPNVKGPPAVIYQTENVSGKMATNGWWSSLAWVPFSERQFPHPLAVQAQASGLRVFYPGTSIRATERVIFGSMPGGGADLVLGHSEQATFDDARVDGFSDWFVDVRFGSGNRSMTVSYGHGSPYVFARYQGGMPTVAFAKPPVVWAGNERSPVLGITVEGRHYALFGPAGATWSGLGGERLVCRSTENYFSLAVLPEADEATLALFRRYAHNHVTATEVAWRFDESNSTVVATYTFTTAAREGNAKGTLFALYPHQWRHATTRLLNAGYASVRGAMKLGEGSSFETRVQYPGVLPCLPEVGGCNRQRITAMLRDEAARAAPPPKDTYWEGKWLGRTATLAAIAEQYGMNDEAGALRERLQERLEEWFTATGNDGRAKHRTVFAYEPNWGTLIGYPASYGSDTDLNDHHFHYGYFIRAAAEVARYKPDWAADDEFGGAVKLLIRDIASPSRRDAAFPFLRCFDVYAGHSWASGSAKFADGNNQESSSEAMNAWCALILWGEAVGDRTIRDLGVFLYTTEMSAIEEYWFDVHQENHPKGFGHTVAAIIWGGKSAHETWFSANPECIHGINWLPIHGGSLYLGRWPEYIERNYAALVHENGGEKWDAWADLMWMYRALIDPEDAMRQFDAGIASAPLEGGNSPANAYHWIGNLRRLGRVDRTVTADTPLYAVFRSGETRTYVVYQMDDRRRTVRFSDGRELVADGKGFHVVTGE